MLRAGPRPPPSPGARCSAVPLPTFPAPPCLKALKAVKARSASGVSVQVEGLQRRPRQPTTLGFLTPPWGPSLSLSSSGPSPRPFRLCPLLSASRNPLP